MTPFKSQPIAAQRLSRRRLLQAGAGCAGLQLGGLNLGGLLWAQSAAALELTRAATVRSCILLFYYGGPSHLDTYDMKPAAPVEVRGEFAPIQSSVPGLVVSEYLPRMARLMHKVALVRSVHHKNGLHDSASTEALTGRPSPNGDREEFAPIPQFFPCHGATLSHLGRDRPFEVPHAALPFVFHNVVDVPCQGGGFLGSMYDPLQISVDPDAQTYKAGELDLPAGQSVSLLGERRELLARIESGAARSPEGRTWQRFHDRAYQLLGSAALREALDLSREDRATRERYGYGPAPVAVGEGGGGGNGAEMGHARQMRGQNLLAARRLVEAGVPFVNVYDFRQQGQNWDSHFNVFNQHKTHLLPLADHALAALIDDLEARGLLESTLVVAMGEFGRTPRINKEGGRDHWPNCYTVLLAGGGVRGGTVYGASDSIGAYPATDPVSPADLAATIFWRFGFDPATEIHDLGGRPYRIAEGRPLTSLFA
jgi:hypothetical protein